ncbi:MAG: serine/threonine-protein kinase [Acidobacteriota bacterium]
MHFRAFFRLPRTTLLSRVILALGLVGVVPFLIALVQLRLSRDALVEQVQGVHLVTVRATADRLSAVLTRLRTTAEATARLEIVRADPGSPDAGAQLVALLEAVPELAAVGLFVVEPDPAGTGDRLAAVQIAQSQGRRALSQALFERPVRGGAIETQIEEDTIWMRLSLPLADDSPARLVLIAALPQLDRILDPDEIGNQASMVLMHANGRVLFASREGRDADADADASAIADASTSIDPQDALASYPPTVVELATSRKLAAGADEYRLPDGRRVVAAFADVAFSQAPWFVLSRQPAVAAEAAAAKLRTIARAAFAIVLAIIAVLSLLAYRTVVRPLRGLIREQRRLAGLEARMQTEATNEIDQLREAFEALEANLHDREALSRVFLGRYQIQSVLGVGAMGTVFRGWDPRLEREVALKTVKLGSGGQDATRAKREELAERLVREAVTLARLNHPNIVTIYDTESAGEAAYLSMELVEGASVQDVLEQQGFLGPEPTLALGLAVLEGLAEAHRHEIVHQDIKPANILLGKTGSIKVTDFGIAELMTAASARADRIFGTVGYLSPEALRGEGFLATSDLFAVGVVMYQCLAGRRPFRGRHPRDVIVATLMHDPKPLTRVRPGVEPALAAAIEGLLAKNPEDRPPSAEEAAEALRRAWTGALPRWDASLVSDQDAKENSPYVQRPHSSLLATERIPPSKVARGGTAGAVTR